MGQLRIESKVFGSTDADASLPDVVLTLATSTVSVRDLIAHAVTAQINELVANQSRSDIETRGLLERHYISDNELQQQVPSGKVALRQYPDQIDPTREIERAIHAFSRGAFAVIANGRHQDSLSDEVLLANAVTVKFLRLTPLAGG